METKFKVGDKVRFIGHLLPHLYNGDKLKDHKDDLHIMGRMDAEGRYQVGYKTGTYTAWWYFKPEEIELIEFTKDNIEPGDVITVRNGDKLYLSSNGYFVDIEGERFNSIASRGDLTNDLLCDGNDRDSDIMKVERPTYHTVYERVEEKKEPKKMTVAEISKELGYDVEIVKG